MVKSLTIMQLNNGESKNGKKLTEKALIKKIDAMSREELTKIIVNLFKTNKSAEAKLNLMFLGEDYGNADGMAIWLYISQNVQRILQCVMAI